MDFCCSVDGGKCQGPIPAHLLSPNILEKGPLELGATSWEGILKTTEIKVLPLGVV